MIHIENLINNSEELKAIVKIAIENEVKKTLKYKNILKETELKRKFEFNANKIAKSSRVQKILNAILKKVVALNTRLAGGSIKTIKPCKKTTKGKAVLFIPTHVFKEDVELVYASMNGYARALVGGQLQIIKTLDEFFLNLSGVNFVNRDNREDRKIVALNIEKQLAAGINQLAFIEGEWNLSINTLVHHLSYSLIEAAIKTNSEIQLVSVDRENKKFFINYGERVDMGIYLEKYNNIKNQESEKRKFLSELAFELRDKLATLKYETMVYKEAYIRGVDLNKVEVKCPENRDYVYYTKRSELCENYAAKEITKIIEKCPILDLIDCQKYIYRPKTDDWAFYNEFHSRERVVNGEIIRTYID